MNVITEIVSRRDSGISLDNLLRRNFRFLQYSPMIVSFCGDGYSSLFWLIRPKNVGGRQSFDQRDQSPNTNGARECTRQIASDLGRIESIISLRDGMILAYKR